MTPNPLTPKKIGSYELVDVIAETGMGKVFKARDPELDRFVAIKTLSPELAANATARARFLREAKAMATLQDDSILPVYEVDQEEQPWFAMRYVAGGTLADAISSKAPILNSEDFLINLATQLSSALATAHTAGITHRDVKPSNILLSKDGKRIWLADFGIARTTEDPSLTYENNVPGTPRYMSPEQALGHKIDHRTDLFSLGSVLYHVACGRPPFEASNSTAILHKVSVASFTPIQRLNRNTPSWLADLIHRLLSKDPADRPSNLAEELRLKKQPIKKKTPLFLVMAALAMAAIITTGSMALLSKENGSEKKPPSLLSPITNDSGENYTDLSEAIRTSPPGSTLQLRGDFLLTEPVVRKSTGGLHLKAAPGASTTIEIDHNEAHGIIINGNLSAKGIHFIRKSPRKTCYTLSGQGSDLIEVTDCRFTTPVERAGTFIYGVSSFSGANTIVRNCSFHGKRFYSILLRADGKRATPPKVSLTVEESFMQGSTGIFVRLGFNRPTLKITGRKVIMDGKRFLRIGNDSALGHTELDFSECLLGCRNEHVLIESADQGTLSRYLTWKTRHNIFSPTGILLRTITPRLNLRTPESINSTIPHFAESENQEQEVFDFFGNLSSSVDHPTTEIFHRHHAP